MRSFRALKIPKPRVRLPNDILFPLDVEIGSGVGKHAIEYALKNPKRTLIAIDKSLVRHQKMMDQIHKHGKISNLIPIRENAVWFVTHEIQKEMVENYFFLYPNPYPKKRQGNKRWHRMPFMQHVIETLKPGGKIHVATNMKFFAEEAEEYLSKIWNLKLVEKISYKGLEQIPFPPRTHFEKKYLERGQTCWNFIFLKD